MKGNRESTATIASVLLLLPSIGCITVPPTGTSGSIDGYVENWNKKGWRLRETAETSHKKFGDAARFQVKDPSSDGNSVTTADIGIVYTQEYWSRLEIGLGIEYHSNSVSDSPTESSAYGVVGSYLLQRDVAPVQTDPSSKLNFSLRRRIDHEGEQDASILKLGLDYHDPSWATPPSKKGSGKLITFTPAFGVLHEDFDSTSTSGNGSATSSWLDLESKLFILPRVFNGNFAIVGRNQTWFALDSSGSLDERKKELNYFRVGFEYTPSASETSPFSIGLDYVEGDNPETGKLDEEYVLLSIKLKI